MCTDPKMRAAFLRELRSELAARRDVRKAQIFPDTGRSEGWQPLVLSVAAPVVLAAALALLWF